MKNNTGYSGQINMENDKEKKSGFGKGVAAGFFIGVMTLFTVLTIVIVVFQEKGYIHFGDNQGIYVQDTSTKNGEGIGSEVEEKLNTINSLLGQKFYFDKADEQKAKDNIYKAYVSTYDDKYTVYYTPEEYKEITESVSGKFYGIGAVCQKQDDGTILVIDAYDDAPAYKAGIRTNDRITKVNGEDISDCDLSTAVGKIKGDKGTEVELEVIRGSESLTFKVTRDEIHAKTVKYDMLDGNIGHIAISQFDTVTKQQFKDALDALKAQGMTSLVIDLRNNPGGMMDAVTNILDEILPDGLIVYTEDKDGKRQEVKGKNSDQLDVPLAVLVNKNSASASEIFAGAVQDYGIGKIIGTQTFGKGIVQNIQPFSDGSAVKYTMAKYYTPKGQDIHGVGVTPDQVVEQPEDATEDLQLNAAIEYLKSSH